MASQIDCLQKKGQQGFPVLAERVCEIHKNNKLAFIHTEAQSSDDVLKCQDCIIDQCLNTTSLLSLSQISTSDELTVFRNWPVGDNELYEKLKALSARPKKDSKLEEEVDKYFKQLKSTVLNKIDVIHESMKKKAQEIQMGNQQILQQYSKMSAKDDLKKVLSDTSTDTKALSSKIREIIVGVQANKHNNSSSLKYNLGCLAVYENQVDFEAPKEIQKEIISQIEKLTMFPSCGFQGNPDLWNQGDWMLPKYQSSSQLKLQYSNGGVTVTQEKSLDGQAVSSNRLLNHLVYTLKCTFNKPLNDCSNIRVGLIPEDKIDVYGLGSLDHIHFATSTGQGTSKTIKGQQLNEEPLSSILTTFYFKICIQTQTFLVMDESHKNVNQTEKQEINPTQKYRFGIKFYTPGNDYKCLFSELKASSDLANADKF